MNSRERVLLTFDRKLPDRVPMWCGASPEFIKKAMNYIEASDTESVYIRFHDDFRRVYAVYDGPREHAPDYNLPEGVTVRSPFGVDRHGYGYGQPTGHPLAEATLEEVHAYPWPDPKWMSAENIKKDALKWNGEYAILGGDWSPFWHDAIDLLGMEGLLVKMYEEPEIVEAVLQHLVDYYYGVSERIFEAAADVIDIFFMGNDMGTQTGPMVGEKLFRQFLFPHFKRLAELGHRYGLKVMLHCCGGFAPLIPCLAEAGIDALQSLQPDANGMEPAILKKNYGDIMIFNGSVDSHHILIDGTPELVREKTKEILKTMMPGGGFILSPSHDYLLEETPVENVLEMYDTVMQYGNYIQK